MLPARALIALFLAGCGSAALAPTDGSADLANARDGAPAPTAGDAATGPGVGLAAKYPGDVGIASDPAVVFAEDFEEGSIAAVTARYDDKKPGGLALASDTPAASRGTASLALTSGGTGPSATDLFKQLPSSEELWIRYYVKYQAGIEWHHSGVWVGGYDPKTNYPNPMAGLKPNGDDRFSIAFEPVGATAGDSNPRMDFYDYWMDMHSWQDIPMGSQAYYGNTVVHQQSLTTKDGAWQCVELHVKVNPDPASPSGAELGLFIDDQPIVELTDAGPLGWWVKDKFCPANADGPECTSYPPPSGTTLLPLDLRLRSVATLALNWFWPQSYVTSGPAGTMNLDDVVIARAQVGCIR